jgi:hypothetical protein
MPTNNPQTLLNRARLFLAHRPAISAAAAVVVPLAAAPVAEAGYLSPWQFADARYQFGQTSPGTVSDTLTVATTTGGSSATGTARYVLNKTAIGQIGGTYTGLNAGSVAVNDRVTYTWSFTLTDSGAAPLAGVEWTLWGYYQVRFGSSVSYALATGSGLGSFSGSRDYLFTTTSSDLNWHGMNLVTTSAAAGDRPGEYQLDVNVNDLSYVYTPVPEPSSGLLAAAAGAGALLLGRGRTRDRQTVP